MPDKSFIPVLRELARAYQAFEAYSAAHIRTLGLTPSQFDIIATLGNTNGMSFKELGEKTLITKGTLTGVVDRLQARNLVRRIASPSDGRSQIVQLTRKGETLFNRVFPAHVSHVDQAFTNIAQPELDEMRSVLSRLRLVFAAAKTK
jgi:MarR family 2-MHQ and catechol resistance regulon transcriptional repressor